MKKSNQFKKLCQTHNVDYENIPEVLSFEEACKITGDDSLKVLPYPNPSNPEEEVSNAHRKLRIFAKAFKGTWIANYNDRSQKKWFPVFNWDANKSAFVFSHSSYYYDLTFTNVGVRLVFPTEEMSDDFAKNYIDIFNTILATA